MDEDIRPGYDRVTEVLDIIRDEGWESFKEMKGPERAEEIRRNAAERGKRFHALFLTSIIDETLLPKEGEEDLQPVRLFQEWYQACGFELIEAEQRRYNDARKYTGRPDLVVRRTRTGRKVLIDYKFTALYPVKAPVQLAAYAGLYSPGEIDDWIVLHFQRSKKAGVTAWRLVPHVYVRSEQDRYNGLWFSALSWWDFMGRRAS